MKLSQRNSRNSGVMICDNVIQLQGVQLQGVGAKKQPEYTCRYLAIE